MTIALPWIFTKDDPSGLELEDRLQENFDALAQQANPFSGVILMGTGSPNGAVVASPPAIYLNRSGGAATTLWVKESGSATNTGWIAK